MTHTADNRHDSDPGLDLMVLLHAYGEAHRRQYARPSDEGNQALGDAARAVYAHFDAHCTQRSSVGGTTTSGEEQAHG